MESNTSNMLAKCPLSQPDFVSKTASRIGQWIMILWWCLIFMPNVLILNAKINKRLFLQVGLQAAKASVKTLLFPLEIPLLKMHCQPPPLLVETIHCLEDSWEWSEKQKPNIQTPKPNFIQRPKDLFFSLRNNLMATHVFFFWEYMPSSV